MIIYTNDLRLLTETIRAAVTVKLLCTKQRFTNKKIITFSTSTCVGNTEFVSLYFFSSISPSFMWNAAFRRFTASVSSGHLPDASKIHITEIRKKIRLISIFQFLSMTFVRIGYIFELALGPFYTQRLRTLLTPRYQQILMKIIAKANINTRSEH